jgi:Raf kinase inhibitor-like YbhB/YbcL family protein
MTGTIRWEVNTMKRLLTLSLSFSMVFSLAAIGFGEGIFQLTSSAFKDGSTIPIKYVMSDIGGSNASIPLSWNNPPEGTKSFALSMIDPHPVANDWVHWMAINIPSATMSLEEGASRKKMPPGSQELLNSYGDRGYGGPRPPKGSGRHPYVITVYSLSIEKIDLDAKASLSAFRQAIGGKVLGEAKLTGFFQQ